tara:strand:- start:253 stop:1488 length:1236 start_codon:yes stop_codon:yes gene_type:complete
MTSLSGLNDGDFTNIDVVYTISINGDAGANNQVLMSNGDTTEYKSITGSVINLEDLTATGGTILIGASPTGAYDGSVARSISVAKVPNALTAGTNITFSSGTTYDGSSAITINSTDTDTTYQAGNGIEIDTATNPDTIKAKPDEDTIDFDGDELAVQKVPEQLTAGANISFSSGSTYDGSSAITINATDTNTTYAGGNNISIDTSANPDEIDLDESITSMTSIAFKTDSTTTTLSGNSYPSGETAMTNFKITDTSNIISPYFFVDVYDPSGADADSLSTSYSAIFSSNLSNSFTAKATSCMISLQVFNYSISSNRWLYLQLGDASGTEWSSGTNQGGYGTGTRSTARLIHYCDETDKQLETVEWYLSGLTIGTTYTVNPMAKTSSTLNYIYAGGSYPACIFKGYYLPSAGI